MQLVYFLIVSVALYWIASRALDLLESRLGKQLEHRSVVFFVTLLCLALITFWLIRRLASG